MASPRPKHGNIFFDKKTGNLIEVGGSIGNSILNGCAEKIHAKEYKPKGKGQSYISLELTSNGIIKENFYPLYSKLPINIQSEMKRQLYVFMNLNLS